MYNYSIRKYSSGNLGIGSTKSMTIDALNGIFKKVSEVEGYSFYYLFSGCTGLSGSLKFSNLRNIKGNSFYSCFAGCTGLTGEVSFPKLTSVSDNGLYFCFNGCTGLTSVSFPNLTNVVSKGLYCCFTDCTGLTSVSFPNLTTIGSGSFYNCFNGCTGLTSVSFPNLTNVGSGNGLSYCFAGCTGLTSVSFPNLTYVGSGDGLFYCFTDCTGLTSVSFPKLTTVGDGGLYYCFNGCTNLKEVHFHYSLEGNAECTASKMGCDNATVYFDLGKTKYTFTNIASSSIYLLASYYINGELLDTPTISYGYLKPLENNVILVYRSGWCLYIENIIPPDETPIERAISLNPNGVTYSLTINGVSDVTPSTTFSYSGYKFATIEGLTPNVIVPEGTEIAYEVTANGYSVASGTFSGIDGISEITVTMEKI